MSDALTLAISQAGTAAALARALGVSKSAISNWRRRGRVPAGSAVAIHLRYGVPLVGLLGAAQVRALSGPERQA